MHVYVRDAVEADAARLSELTGSPEDVMRNLVHDRAVRVASDDDDEVHGFVSFDASGRIVHVTQIEGPGGVCERLLEEPLRFASNEDMLVEILVAEDDEETREAVERQGFESDGYGPFFDGTRTVRYRHRGRDGGGPTESNNESASGDA